MVRGEKNRQWAKLRKHKGAMKKANLTPLDRTMEIKPGENQRAILQASNTLMHGTLMDRLHSALNFLLELCPHSSSSWTAIALGTEIREYKTLLHSLFYNKKSLQTLI